MEINLKVQQVALGSNGDGVCKTPCLHLDFDLQGIVGDRHAGFTKPADGRDGGVKRGEVIRNWRQWSAVSIEELDKIATTLNAGKIEPAWFGANITFSGYEGFTAIPKGSTIWFESGLILTVEGENAPCQGPGKIISSNIPHIRAHEFPKAAKNLRGLVGVVYKPGRIVPGDEAIVRVYEPYDAIPKPPKRFAG